MKTNTCEWCTSVFTCKTVRRFCTLSCWYNWTRGKSRNLNPVHVCTHCGKNFTRRFRSVKATKFCTPNCYNEWRRSKQPICVCRTCGCKFRKVCGTPFTRPHQAWFCSQKCSSFSAYLSGGLDYRIRGFIGTVKRVGKLCCERCGDENPHHLTVHHRDGNHSNNADDNLETLCANCHFEIHWTDKPSREHRLKRLQELIAILNGRATRNTKMGWLAQCPRPPEAQQQICQG